MNGRDVNVATLKAMLDNEGVDITIEVREELAIFWLAIFGHSS